MATLSPLVEHLLRRAGFGATAAEREAFDGLPYFDAVARLAGQLSDLETLNQLALEEEDEAAAAEVGQGVADLAAAMDDLEVLALLSGEFDPVTPPPEVKAVTLNFSAVSVINRACLAISFKASLGKNSSTLLSANAPITAPGIEPITINHASCRSGSSPILRSMMLATPARIKRTQSFAKNASTEINVPMCNATSNGKLLIKSLSQPNNHGTKSKCAELEMGKNSVRP